MNTTNFRRTTGVRIAGLAIAAAALVLPDAPAVAAGGLRDCADVTGHSAERIACQEPVWVDGSQVRMTFFAGATGFPGGTPSDQLARLYLVAPQTATAQETVPFTHDHVVRNVPRQNGGSYSVLLRGFFVFCASTACAPGTTPTPFGMPFAMTVN